MCGKMIGMWIVEGEGVEKYEFPEEFFEELEQIHIKATKKLGNLKKRYERVKKAIIEKEYEEVKELQKKYLEAAGFRVR